MIHGSEIKVTATRARIASHIGEDFVLVEIDAVAAPDFALALTSDQARALAEQLMHPTGSAEYLFRRPARWLSRFRRRRS